ncbi:MAG: hypothetical protein ABSC18_15125 [Verrucomicrobiota bacterium]|jgi:hypothetical protein
MKSKISRKLVIDASVARASGGLDAAKPCPARCRDFMLKALEVCHRVVMTPDIRAEWKRHQSIFARGWLVSMVSKRKFLFARNCEDAQLRQTIANLAPLQWPVTKMLKDIHLIEASLSGDRIVISLDEAARTHFARASSVASQLKEVVWRNPATEMDLGAWLEKGAQAEASMKLGFTPGAA